VINADGNGVTTLATMGDNSEPSWSPDGTKLVFASSRDGNQELYVVNSDGTGEKRSTDDSWSDAAPAWRPEVGLD